MGLAILPILGAALAIGFTGNLVAQAPGDPGLGLSIFFTVLAVASLTIMRISRPAWRREALWWVLVGALASLAFMVRESPLLRLLVFGAAASAFAFAAMQPATARLRRSGVSDYLEAMIAAWGNSLLGAGRILLPALLGRIGDLPSASGGQGSHQPLLSPSVAAVLRGSALAAPLLLLFILLLAAADQIFADLVTGVFGSMAGTWGPHLALTAVLSWFAVGYLTGLVSPLQLRHHLEKRVASPSLGIIEVGIPLLLLILLFALFVTVQLRFLFGGSDLVQVIPGLTYAEYARRGFGQLVVASALILPTLLLADWLLRDAGRRERRLFSALGTTQLLLLGVVMLSALERVRVYHHAYGLTEPRLYGALFVVWLAGVAAWLGGTILTSRSRHFALPVVVSGYILVAVLVAISPPV